MIRWTGLAPWEFVDLLEQRGQLLLLDQRLDRLLPARVSERESSLLITFVWELTEETIDLPPGWTGAGGGPALAWAGVGRSKRGMDWVVVPGKVGDGGRLFDGRCSGFRAERLLRCGIGWEKMWRSRGVCRCFPGVLPTFVSSYLPTCLPTSQPANQPTRQPASQFTNQPTNQPMNRW